jgi:DNA-binding Xre family transcriptional regulator
MSAFKSNIDMYLAEKDITIRSLSEEADIPFETLKNFLYGNTQDCKLSTAVKLARALNVSVDELIGAETLRFDFKNNCAICRNLPDNSMYLINWLVRHQESLYNGLEKDRRIISVMDIVETHGGNLRSSGEYDHIDITDFEPDLRAKIFLGIRFETERYMPIYSPYDILMIAYDRFPYRNENCVIIHGGHFYVAKRYIENGIAKYKTLKAQHFIAEEKDIDELVGYVTHAVNINTLKKQIS